MDIDTTDTLRLLFAILIMIIITVILLTALSTIDVSAQEPICSHAWISPTPTCKWDAMWYFYEMRRQGVHYYGSVGQIPWVDN
jgi:hypothetical protein